MEPLDAFELASEAQTIGADRESHVLDIALECTGLSRR